jgi:hypothetical protein
MLSQLVSVVDATALGMQLLTRLPFTHAMVPVAAQAPVEQPTFMTGNSSSTMPSQSSSIPSQVTSEAADGGSGTQLSTGLPVVHRSAPWLRHAPWPHVVVMPNPSSAAPSQLSSTPSQVASALFRGGAAWHAVSTPATHEDGVL